MNTIIFIIICSLLYDSVISSSKCDQDKLIIETLNGRIKGKCESLTLSLDDGTSKVKEVYSWLSIPYAQPPIKELRFKQPQPVKSWTDTLDATKIPNACMQFINKDLTERFEFTNALGISKYASMNEDCLYLNIFVPSDVRMSEDKVPIVVFFHGGDGEIGSGLNDIYNPSITTTMTGTIFVTFNYRLGIFGSLFLREKNMQEVYEGNQAIMDQHLVLKWVYENAARFNGDPNRITLMGHEAGARYIGYHLIYQPSWLYFRNVIMLSGSPVHLNKNIITPDLANNRTKLFLKLTYNCEQSNKYAECLSNADASNLTISTRLFLNKIMSNGSQLSALNIKSPFVPVFDNKIFKESPIRSFRLGNFKKCNIIMSFNGNDGSSLIPLNYAFNATSQFKQTINFTQLTDFIRKFYFFYPHWPLKNNELIINSILNEYTHLTSRLIHNEENYKTNYFSTLSRILTDESFACPTFKLINYLSKIATNNKIHLFVYNNRISTTRWPGYYGAVNGDIIPMIFGQPFNNDPSNKQFPVSYNPWKANSYLQRDKQISKEIIIRLGNFIRDNDPNSRISNLDNKSWPSFKLATYELNDSDNNTNTRNELLYLNVRSNGTIVNKLSQHHDSCHLWNSLIPSHLDVLNEMKLESTKRS